MASTLFRREAYRAAFDFDLEDGLAFLLAAFVVLRWLVACDVAVLFDELRERRECVAALRVLLCGASRTGSETASVCPTLTVLEERRFQRRRSSTLTPKRSATVISVSPRL